MAMLVDVTFKNFEPTAAVRAQVERRAAALEKFFPDILRCRVMVEVPHRHRREGRPHHVRVELFVPGACLVAGRDPSLRESHADLSVAIRDAFHAARRELMDYVRRLRLEVKSHVGPGVARVAKLLPDGCGFLETESGRSVYFHRNSVIDGAGALAVGTRVHFSEEMGEDGPQASTVTLAGRHVRSRVRSRS